MRVTTIRIATAELEVHECTTRVERLRGLLGRPPLPRGHALLIDPCRAIHTFGMRVAIDVVFCAADGRILRIVHSLPRRRWAVHWRARRVYEFRAGEAARLQLAVARASAGRPVPPARRRRRGVGALLAAIGALVTAGCTATGAADRTVGRASAAATTTTTTTPTTTAAIAATATTAASETAPTTATAHLPGRTTATRARAAVDDAPTDELRLQADLDYQSHEWLLAEPALRELARREPAIAAHWARLGTVFLHTGRVDAAAEALAAAARLAAPGAGERENLAVARLLQARRELAALSQTPGDGGVLRSVASRRPELVALLNAIDAALPVELSPAARGGAR